MTAITYMVSHLSETLVAIDTQIWSSASEPCRGEIIGYVYDGFTWDFLASAKETFELGAFGTEHFNIEVEIPSGHWDVKDNVEVTDVEIQY